MVVKLDISTPEAMEALGKELSGRGRAGLRIFINGELGAGKTTIVRGFLHGLGYPGKVKSPTYTLVEPYEFDRFTVYHFDLYRLEQPLELEAIGFRDYFDGNGICLVEWAVRAGNILGPGDIVIAIQILPDGRQVTITPGTTSGHKLLESIFASRRKAAV